MNIFDGLYGYEIVMLGMGVVLFFVAIFVLLRAAMNLRGGSYPSGMAMLIGVVVLVGYPGIQSIQFEKDKIAIQKLAHDGLPPGATSAQKAAAQTRIASVEQRATTPQAQAVVATAYQKIGALDKAYDLATKVAAENPPAAVSKELVPIVTQKLDQITPSQPGTPVVDPKTRTEIAKIATQLQAQAPALPADAHIAIAKAQLALGEESRAAASLQAARRVNPNVRIDPGLLEKLKAPEPAH